MNDIIREESFFSSKYNIFAVIDFYHKDKKILIEKKRNIKRLYKGYIFQAYAQYYALIDNGEDIHHIFLYSITDKKFYPIPLPRDSLKLKKEFELTLLRMRHFQIEKFFQTNELKCKKCIYRNLCDRSLYD